MLNDLIERRKVLAESEQHKDRRNELNALASKNARERNELNAQTREFVEEAQRHKEQRDAINEEVQALKEQRNEYNDKANALFEELEVFKKEHGNLRNRGIKELQKQIEHLEFKQQTEVYSTDKERGDREDQTPEKLSGTRRRPAEQSACKTLARIPQQA